MGGCHGDPGNGGQSVGGLALPEHGEGRINVARREVAGVDKGVRGGGSLKCHM